MSKFLRTIRFDRSDELLFDLAARPGEWAVSGAFAFADATAAGMILPQEQQAFESGFLGLESFGRSTFASVASAPPEQIAEIELALARHFVDRYGAPDLDSARVAARDEIAFIVDLVAGARIGTVFSVARHRDERDRITEEFRAANASTGNLQGRLWTFEPDEP